MLVRWIFYFCGKEGTHLNRRYLTAVTPLPDHVLQVDFVSGIFVRFGDVELSHDEILSMAEQEH